MAKGQSAGKAIEDILRRTKRRFSARAPRSTRAATTLCARLDSIKPSRWIRSISTLPLLSVHEPTLFVNLIAPKPEQCSELRRFDLV